MTSGPVVRPAVEGQVRSFGAGSGVLERVLPVRLGDTTHGEHSATPDKPHFGGACSLCVACVMWISYGASVYTAHDGLGEDGVGLGVRAETVCSLHQRDPTLVIVTSI